MADTPNLDNPSTPEDFKALAALRTAQAEAIKAETTLLTAKKDLAKAQTPDPAAAAITAATQAASLAAQQRALSDSEAAILKNTLSVPTAEYKGEVKVGDKAGTIEAALLASRAITIAAEKIAATVGDKARGPIVLFGSSDLPDFQALIAFDAQFNAIDAAVSRAAAKLKAAATTEAPRKSITEVITPAVIGAGLEAVDKLLGFFRTDYSVQGVAIANDDLLLLSALAGSLSNKSMTVEVPALYNSSAVLQTSPVLLHLQGLAQRRIELQQAYDAAVASLEVLNNAAAHGTEQEKREATATLATLKPAVEQARITLASYDAFLTKLTTADEKGKFAVVTVVQQDAVRNKLKAAAHLMIARVSTTGGTCYTRKNLWSFLGTMPFFTMGGVVVSYTLIDGRTGAVISAGTIPVDGGFYKVNRLPPEILAR
ncbi:hypothetical protein [Opitutus sp. ER46]|uniref:hypothetical protein n=1 Tax=Opitutus sp. ER46 TaxID=2161864 RepID=UPI001304ADA4|nr:hypothetical protein [Opitutus sp. ER46]